MSENHAIRILVGLLFFSSLLVAAPLLAASPNFVELKNGDHISGDVDSLERGLLQFSTDHMGTISIEWEQVARLESDLVLEVEASSGQRSFGKISTRTEDGMLLIGEDETLTEYSIVDTIRMSPLEESGKLIDKMDAYVDLGFSDTKATSVRQLSFDAGISYRSRENLWELDFTTMQSDSETDDSNSTTLKGSRQHPFGNRWYWSGLMQLDRNDELGLDLRTLAGGTLGRYLKQTNQQQFALGAGLGVAREELADGGRTDSVELLLAMDWEVFRFSDPELDISTQIAVIPSLTVSGRVRGQAQIRLRYEIFADLFAELTLSESFDSKPQSLDAEKNDYTITTSLGYSF